MSKQKKISDRSKLLGAFFAEKRKELNIAPKKIARHLNVSVQHVCDYEKGRSFLGIKKINKIMQFFKIEGASNMESGVRKIIKEIHKKEMDDLLKIS